MNKRIIAMDKGELVSDISEGGRLDEGGMLG
jgi:hypothetical protein